MSNVHGFGNFPRQDAPQRQPPRQPYPQQGRQFQPRQDEEGPGFMEGFQGNALEEQLRLA